MDDDQKGHRVPANTCPCCGKKLDGAAANERDSRAPRPGDVSVCIYCAAILQFGEGMVLRQMPAEVLDEMDAESVIELHRIVMVIERMIKGRKDATRH